jgi:chemotaxis-related protein WspD
MTDPEAKSLEVETALTKLLSREPPEGYRSEWTRHVSEHKAKDVKELRTCVVFRIGTSFLALPAAVVDSIAEDSPFHSIPQRRSGIPVTLANVRGELLVCVSLQKLFNIETTPEAGAGGKKIYRRLVACARNDERLAFPVDEVCAVEQYRADIVSDLPATLAGYIKNYSRGLISIRNRTVALIDVELLFAALSKNLT